MKSTVIIALILIFTWAGCSAQTGDEFDFWVGHWDLTWDMGEGKTGHGVNHILKILDGKVIQENFEATDAGATTGFKGTSISVFNTNTGVWHQAWADNQGGYFDFIGEIDGERRIFKTKPIVRNDKTMISRMVFYDISEDTFTWDWESSEDGGKSWSLRWRINYKRAN